MLIHDCTSSNVTTECAHHKPYDQGGALLEFPIRTAMHGEYRVSSAIFVFDNKQNFTIGFSTVAVAQWTRHWNSGHRVVQAEGSNLGGDIYQSFSAMIFISVI